MLPKIVRWLWGDLTSEELQRFSLLSATLLFIIGAYWLLRPLKDGAFNAIVGIQYQPRAKMISLLILIPLILLYSKLVDMMEKHKLFYLLGSIYFVFFVGCAYMLSHPTIGLPNMVAGGDRMLGWIFYVGIETFGSLMVSLFWSLVNSSTEASSAKKGYPLVIFGAQFGSILGPTLATHSHFFGLPLLTYFSAAGVAIAIVMISVFMAFSANTAPVATAAKSTKKPTGIIEGLKLLLTRPYVMGIFCISTVYEVVGTILDYQMKVLGSQAYPTAESFTKFLGHFGQAVNGLALVFALVGTSFFMRRFGLTFCLILFPMTVGLVVGYVYFFPALWVVFGGMVAIKGLSYALNNPTKEVMYIPTSKDVKFKAKGWIDMFGGRSAKSLGSAVTDNLKHSVEGLMNYGTAISLVMVAGWIGVAAYVGKTFNKLTKENKIID
jgi:ATP:ADP antiporter, AAA family